MSLWTNIVGTLEQIFTINKLANFDASNVTASRDITLPDSDLNFHSGSVGDVLTKGASGIDFQPASGGAGLAKWVSGATYAIDDVVWLLADNKIYRCITANSDITFVYANWVELSRT